jgi:putative ATP-dependent endonuclease of OLD family
VKVCCLVEGLSDKFAFEKWAYRLGYDIKRQGIHFIPMDGCQNMDYFASVSILHDFNVPFRIVLDKDSHGETNSSERVQFLKAKIPRLKHNCFVMLEKGELENYFCVDTTATVLNISREFIDDEHYKRDPKEELKSATKKAIDAGSKNARRYRETEHSRVIAEIMPMTTLNEEIVLIIKGLCEQAETSTKAIYEIQQGLAEVAAEK